MWEEIISQREFQVNLQTLEQVRISKQDQDISELVINQNKKKIVAIYSHPFDFPHCYGMKRFNDMLDWLELTIEKASLNKNIICY